MATLLVFFFIHSVPTISFFTLFLCPGIHFFNLPIKYQQPIIHFFILLFLNYKKAYFIYSSIVCSQSYLHFHVRMQKKIKFLTLIVNLVSIFSSGSSLFFMIMNSTFCWIYIIGSTFNYLDIFLCLMKMKKKLRNKKFIFYFFNI